MKKLAVGFIVSTFFASIAFAGIKVTNHEVDTESVYLRFETTEEFSSRCSLVTKSVNVTLPEGDELGSIVVTASRNPRAVCLAAFGPHSGSVKINRGESLPDLVDGSYVVEINGSETGVLTLSEDGSSFDSEIDLSTNSVHVVSGNHISTALLLSVRDFMNEHGEPAVLKPLGRNGFVLEDKFVDAGTVIKCYEKSSGPHLPAFTNVCEIKLSARAKANGGVVSGSRIGGVLISALTKYARKNPEAGVTVRNKKVILSDEFLSPGTSITAYTRKMGEHLPAFEDVVEFKFGN